VDVTRLRVSPTRFSIRVERGDGLSAPRRILHFAEDGDTSGYFPALAKYHDRDRYRMTFATLKPMAPWLAEFMRGTGVDVYSVSAGGRLGYPAAIARLVTRLRSHPVDIFHAHLFDPSFVGLVSARIAGVRMRVLTRHYSNYHTRINRPLHVGIDKLCTALSHHVIAVSRETAEHLIAVEGAPPAKVTAIHNGIDFERVRVSGPDARADIRRELAIGDEFVFLIAGRLHPEKGYDVLFEAVRDLKRRVPRPFVLIIAGKGPFQEHYLRESERLGIADRVRFLGFRKDLPDLMVACDLFVLPSVAEAFGLVLAEALYLGAPVLASRVGGIPEIVDDGVDGLLVSPGDAVALSRAMEGWLCGRVDLPGRGEFALRKVLARFDFRAMMRAYESVYDRLVEPLR